MAITVNTNITSLQAQHNLNGSQASLSQSLARLSSGLRINSAKDDAAGLAISQTLTSAIRGNNQAINNANDGISVGQTAEGALGQIANNLQRIREIAVQSANGSASNTNRSQMQSEVDQLTQEISRIVQTTQFNGTQLLSGSAVLMFQIGSSGDPSNQVSVSSVDLATSSTLNSFNSSLTNTGTINITTQSGASSILSALDKDIAQVSTVRSNWGAVQNRFDAVVANLQNYTQNLTAAKSRIMDVDFASETANLTRNQILQQAGSSILKQANSLPQSALTLLQ
ncbi:flagellin FliC [Chromobacterium phragmitis]|uniref:flagellin N-terminal helical domain-containing protein n=1 Tax=Chromobacterium amazonense TaxID=1382803 RepID=UPI0021B739CC|nr:flagellin [Chromobacterium amazonense]MBM2885172.1 flagellin FliC [Chromobacterium amazonense]MDE1715526.1 flagellin [Chromobacterium amazonense]